MLESRAGCVLEGEESSGNRGYPCMLCMWCSGWMWAGFFPDISAGILDHYRRERGRAGKELGVAVEEPEEQKSPADLDRVTSSSP